MKIPYCLKIGSKLDKTCCSSLSKSILTYSKDREQFHSSRYRGTRKKTEPKLFHGHYIWNWHRRLEFFEPWNDIAFWPAHWWHSKYRFLHGFTWYKSRFYKSLIYQHFHLVVYVKSEVSEQDPISFLRLYCRESIPLRQSLGELDSRRLRCFSYPVQ